MTRITLSFCQTRSHDFFEIQSDVSHSAPDAILLAERKGFASTLFLLLLPEKDNEPQDDEECRYACDE